MEFFDRRSAPKRADTWFVYALVDSRQPKDFRYIGITNNPKARLSLHLSRAQKEGWKKSRWIGSVIDAGGTVLMGVIATGLTQDDAMAMEVRLIAEHRASGSRLMNLTDGGDGVKGQVQSAEARAKKSAAMKGKPKSAEHVANMSEAKRGIKQSDKARANMSAAHKARYDADPRQRERQRTNNILRFEDPGEREKISKSLRKRFEDPAEREKISLASTRAMADPKVREKISVAVKVRWSDPELLKKQSETMLRRFSDPKELEMLAAERRLRGPTRGEYKGVSFMPKIGKWRARIHIDGKERYIGTFVTAMEAATAYDEAAFSEWGEDCYLNLSAAKTA
ncbi:GIY-YIG nuclease family protein [Sinorhizobium meliloti]|uniref:GIY-YIG nuclease family protein n=1 Tax=Rhizobium meliloti TaxID=382 RepID=UPI000FDB8B49|nr:AP2 domain-containing protein [Sinorhizobium meliloti]RVN04655.1 hypothetical protein CN112_25045 [Sinorhizobium meliloti]